MAITTSGTTLTFNDATTQTTAGVTSITAGTGISSSGGLTPTITNSGVTSIVAGTGISVSGATGAVTVSASGGGVTSLNGNTGALKGLDLISTGTVSAGSTSFNISSLPSGYAYFKIYFTLICGTATSNYTGIGIRWSTNGGSTFITSNYNLNTYGYGSNSSSTMTAGSAGTNNAYCDTTGEQQTNGIWGSTGASTANWDCTLYQPANGTWTVMETMEGWQDVGGNTGSISYYYGRHVNSGTPTTYVNGLQIFRTSFNSGGKTFAGTYSVYGMKNA